MSAFLATARLGGIAVLVNPALTADEHRFMAEDSKAVLCVSAPGIGPLRGGPLAGGGPAVGAGLHRFPGDRR